MNFFFGINNNIFKSKIQIPIFKNRDLKKTSLKLFKTFPKNNKWVLQEVLNKKKNDYFYTLQDEEVLNNEIFFLAYDSIFKEFDDSFEINTILKDGDIVKVGDIAFTVNGPSITLLSAERLVLNVMQRMSAIATLTNKYVKEVR